MSDMKQYIKLEDLHKFPIRRNHYDKEHGNEHFINGIETVFEYAENLPTYDFAQKNEWISVKDRLPEEDIRVLVYINSDRSYTKLDTDRLSNGKFVRWYKDVTHWMPLPEPPKV